MWAKFRMKELIRGVGKRTSTIWTNKKTKILHISIKGRLAEENKVKELNEILQKHLWASLEKETDSPKYYQVIEH